MRVEIQTTGDNQRHLGSLTTYNRFVNVRYRSDTSFGPQDYGKERPYPYKDLGDLSRDGESGLRVRMTRVDTYF